MKPTLRLTSIIGIILFSALFLVTFASPEAIEKSAKGFVEYQIEKEIRQTQVAVQESDLAEKARSLANRFGLDADKIEQDLEDNLPEKIAEVVASLCGYDCEKKKALSRSITAGYLERLSNLRIAENNLSEIIKGKYLKILRNLKLDLRIFLGSNLAMFLILLSVSYAKPKAMAQLFVPASLLFLSTVISSAIYIFGQDWFYTIIYNDYMGFGYLGYISLIFAFLLDIILNRARVTTVIFNFLAHAVGAVASAIPC